MGITPNTAEEAAAAAELAVPLVKKVVLAYSVERVEAEAVTPQEVKQEPLVVLGVHMLLEVLAMLVVVP